jgi:hypothetical protein
MSSSHPSSQHQKATPTAPGLGIIIPTLPLTPTSFANISMPFSKCAFGLIGGLSSLPLLSATSIPMSLFLASTRGAGTRFVLRRVGDGAREVMLEDVGQRVTVLDSVESWRVWLLVVWEVAVTGREVEQL